MKGELLVLVLVLTLVASRELYDRAPNESCNYRHHFQESENSYLLQLRRGSTGDLNEVTSKGKDCFPRKGTCLMLMVR